LVVGFTFDGDESVTAAIDASATGMSTHDAARYRIAERAIAANGLPTRTIVAMQIDPV